jgi:hypothetical protein
LRSAEHLPRAEQQLARARSELAMHPLLTGAKPRESAEELRLLMLQLLAQMLQPLDESADVQQPEHEQAQQKQLELCIAALVQILACTSRDRHPSIVQACNTCAVRLAPLLRRMHTAKRAEYFKELIKALCLNLTHKRANVRLSAVKALGSLAEHGSESGNNNSSNAAAVDCDAAADARHACGE